MKGCVYCNSPLEYLIKMHKVTVHINQVIGYDIISVHNELQYTWS